MNEQNHFTFGGYLCSVNCITFVVTRFKSNIKVNLKQKKLWISFSPGVPPTITETISYLVHSFKIIQVSMYVDVNFFCGCKNFTQTKKCGDLVSTCMFIWSVK